MPTIVPMVERLYLRLADDPVYAPETTVPAGTLRELAVPAALGGDVANVIAYHEELPPGTEVTERVLPDGALRLIVDLNADAPAAPGAARVAGPGTRPVVLRMRGRQQGLSVTLRPGAALALFGVSAHELAEREVPWDELVRPGHRGLVTRLREQRGGDAERACALLAELLALRRARAGVAARASDEERRQALHAATLLRALAAEDGGGGSVRAVARGMTLGERRLQQIFRAQLGLTPRAWGRLARLHECLRRLRHASGAPRWAQVAAESGFYDQAHLVNEFRALCGLTPAQFLTLQRTVQAPAAAAG